MASTCSRSANTCSRAHTTYRCAVTSIRTPSQLMSARRRRWGSPMPPWARWCDRAITPTARRRPRVSSAVEAANGAAAPADRRGAGLGFALAAIALWSTLASLGVALAHVPPFLLTGLALLIGSAPSWPLARQWRIPASTLLLGVYGLFGFHFLLFLALRSAPPLEANLVNYLWPLLIVVLAP